MSDAWFIIWCPTSTKPITRKYTSLAQAVKVREKLTQSNPSEEFHILVNMTEEILKCIVPEISGNSEQRV